MLIKALMTFWIFLTPVLSMSQKVVFTFTDFSSRVIQRASQEIKHIQVFSKEKKIILEVAAEYELTDWQTALLFAIRRAENGRPGREFGVLHPKAIDTDFRNQAQWAAGSIKKRCPDQTYLERFAARWCPIGAKNDPRGLNQYWLKNVMHYHAQFMR